MNVLYFVLLCNTFDNTYCVIKRFEIWETASNPSIFVSKHFPRYSFCVWSISMLVTRYSWILLICNFWMGTRILLKSFTRNYFRPKVTIWRSIALRQMTLQFISIYFAFIVQPANLLSTKYQNAVIVNYLEHRSTYLLSFNVKTNFLSCIGIL